MNQKTKSRIPGNTLVFGGVTVLVIINIYFAFTRGPIMTSDSIFFSGEADRLISLGFNIPQYLGTSVSNYPLLLTMGFILLVALLKILLGQYWGFGLIVFNIIFSSLAIICLFSLVQAYSKHKLTILWGFLLLLVAQDLRLWNAYVLTDAIFSSIFYFTVFFLLTTMKSLKRIGPVHILGLSLLLLTIVFFRPAFPPVLVVVVLYLLWVIIMGKVEEKKGSRINHYLFLLLFFSIVACIFLFAYLIQLVSVGQLKSSSYSLDLVRYFSEGWIIYDRPELSHKPPTTYFEFVFIILERIKFFFVFTSSSFSRLHNLINVLFFIPVYSLAFIGVINFFKPNFKLNDSRNNVFSICIMTIICFSVFHSFTLIDFDWRYRTPIILPLITLACLGADLLIDSLYAADAECN
jgi:hypothetical protein